MIIASSETGRALVTRSVSKRFGSVQALHEVDIEIRPGTVHAVVGENGAGKSTLAKLLAGIETPDSGSMTLGEHAHAPADRAAARAAGVNMVPQQLSLVGELSLVENMLLVGAHRYANRRRARAELTAMLDLIDVRVDVDTPTSKLGQAHRQLGEIVVALAEGARVLILDEPTASLGPLEIGGLFAHLRALCDLGTSIVLITHRLDEVRSVADDVTVLSHGQVVSAGSARGLRPAEIARLMVGDLPPRRPRTVREPGETVLELRSLSARGARDSDVHDVDLRVGAGEIVGLAGVAGSGQNTLIDVLAGLIPPRRGTVRIAGRELGRNRARDALRAGVAWIPEERSAALVPESNLGLNLAILSRATGLPRAPRPDARSSAAQLRDFDVRPPRADLLAGGLSGGNQQKLLVARELGTGSPGEGSPVALLALGATQGLDLRAAQAIRERIAIAAERGTAVLLGSFDLDELLDLADRIVVVFGGRIVADLPTAEADAAILGAAMAGLASSAPDGTTSPTSPDHLETS